MQSKSELLSKFYEEKFQNVELFNGYSSPMLLNTNFVNTDVMVVGQETNSWYGRYDEFRQKGVKAQMTIYDDFRQKGVKAQMTIYDDFINSTPNTTYHRYIKEICGETKPTLNNIFKFDLGDDSGAKSVMSAEPGELDEIVNFHKGVLKNEIDILKPKFIIFFIGNYEKFLGKFLECEMCEVAGFNKNELCKVNLKDFSNITAFKTYHPSYLNRNYKAFGERVKEHLAKALNETL